MSVILEGGLSMKRFLGGLAIVAFSAGALPAQGALGERTSSIAADQARLAGALQTTAAATHSVHEIAAATGTLVREYASASGVVFAVSWQGPFLPDLKQLMGSYYDRYVDAVHARHRGRGPVLLSLPGLVVESAGHPRGFHGRAYVPELVPDGVPLESLR
jgi:hypothetical protein